MDIFFRQRIWILCVVYSVLTGVAFFTVDVRPTTDLGHYYRQLPEFIFFYQGESELSFFELLRISGGWYNALLALLMSLFGVGEWVLQFVSILWVALLFFALKKMNPFGLLLLCSMPILQTSVHTHWLHFVEASFFVGLLFAVQQRRWIWIAGGLLLVSLRPTALLLLFSGVALCWWDNKKQQAKYLLLGTILGSLWIIPEIGDYINGKMTLLHQRSRPLYIDVWEQCFLLPLLLSLIGIGLWFKEGNREKRDWFLLSWLLVPLGIAMFFGVGIDNFLLFHFSLALLGGRGWTMHLKDELQWLQRSSWAVLVILMLPFLPVSIAASLSLPLGRTIVSQEPWHYLRPQREGLQVHHIEPFLKELCERADQQCTIVSSMGLFHPSREEDGSLALFLAGMKDLQIHNAALWWTKQHLEGSDRLEGIIIMDCSLPQEAPIFQNRIDALRQLSERIPVLKLGEVGPPSCPFHIYAIAEPSGKETIRQLQYLGKAIQ